MERERGNHGRGQNYDHTMVLSRASAIAMAHGPNHDQPRGLVWGIGRADNMNGP